MVPTSARHRSSRTSAALAGHAGCRPFATSTTMSTDGVAMLDVFRLMILFILQIGMLGYFH
jgi:hypothetical protein